MRLRGQVRKADDVIVVILMVIQIALLGRPHHDQLVDILRAVDELGKHVVRAVTRFDNLLTAIVIYRCAAPLPGVVQSIEFSYSLIIDPVSRK